MLHRVIHATPGFTAETTPLLTYQKLSRNTLVCEPGGRHAASRSQNCRQVSMATPGGIPANCADHERGGYFLRLVDLDEPVSGIDYVAVGLPILTNC